MKQENEDRIARFEAATKVKTAVIRALDQIGFEVANVELRWPCMPDGRITARISLRFDQTLFDGIEKTPAMICNIELVPEARGALEAAAQALGRLSAAVDGVESSLRSTFANGLRQAKDGVETPASPSALYRRARALCEAAIEMIEISVDGYVSQSSVDEFGNVHLKVVPSTRPEQKDENQGDTP